MSERKPLIWICDDSPTEGAITRRCLGASYEYEYFEDGSIVVERLTTSPRQPDLLVLDWVMPGMAGDEVCRFLRAQEATKDLPIIIATSSRVETHDVVAGLMSGADDYVARPFPPEELRARVNAALRTRELAEASKRERRRLAAVNRLAQALLQVTDVRGIVDALAFSLVGSLADGCGVLLLTAEQVAVAHHRADCAPAIAAIANVTDPLVRAFVDGAAARAQLPAAYHPYIEQCGLTGLAVVTLPESSPIPGVITLTRDAGSPPFDADDITAIETCMEYCSLALQNAMRFDAERLARAQRDAVLESLPVGILVTDTRGRLTLVNTAAAQLLPGITLGHALLDAYRLASWQALDGTPIDEQAWITQNALDTRVRARAQLTMRAADDIERTIEVSALPLDARVPPSGTVIILEDVSAERVVEVERERMSRFQEEMVAIVGHDLRNPLGAFVAGTDLLRDIAGDFPTILPVVQRMRGTADRMTKIVAQLLDVTHARLGKGIPVDLRRTSLRAVLAGVVAESELATPATKFILAGTGDEVLGTWDPDRLAQLFANLTSNAAFYGLPGGPVTVTLEATATSATVLVQNPVRDRPIPPELLPVLFDPFQRGRAGGGNAGGLGLGLYIVREVVTAHGGTIAVTSDVTTTFRVELPR